MTSSDKDFRFMATNDLMAELQKDSIKLDDDSERKVSYACMYSAKTYFLGLQAHLVSKYFSFLFSFVCLFFFDVNLYIPVSSCNLFFFFFFRIISGCSDAFEIA